VHTFNSAGATVVYGETILLGKRILSCGGKKVNFGGYWSIFGGEREPPSESPICCACRELYEETGISLKLNDLNHVSALRRGQYFFDVYISYIDHMPKITLNEEHTEYGWFTIDYLNIDPNPIDPEMANKIIKFHNLKKI
tara:strand:- start:831 stop:1250 length:420 start_codon:yes stop_codon:yes gene_type:complete